MKKIYVYCPGNVLSGGIYSLHNLCAKLAEGGFQAAMVYHSADPRILNHEHIRAYHVPSCVSIEDSSDNILIVSETETLLLTRFMHIQKVVYWLGLNNYFKMPVFRRPFNIKLLRKAIRCRNYYGYTAGPLENYKRRLSWRAKAGDSIWHDPVLHISNSYYAAQCCRWRGIEKVPVLHNPVQEEYYHEAGGPFPKRPKIIFGPKTPKILIALCRIRFSFEIVRLKHMPPALVKQHMKEAMVFAEFGNNSGRDRMPREAALLGCVVFSNTRGSAAFHEDMPIPDRYKIPDKWMNYPGIMKRLKHSIQNYKTAKNDFKAYITAMEEERKQFPAEVKRVFTEMGQ